MSFHLYQINELYSNADGSIQFIEILGEADGQGFWAGHSITVSQGGTSHSFTFPTDLPSEATANTKVLIATQGFANLGLVTPDFIVPAGFLFTNGGTVNYAGVDQVSYAQLPADGSSALDRSGNTVTAVATDFSGASSALPPISGGVVTAIKAANLGVLRVADTDADASAVAASMNSGHLTFTDYVNQLIGQAQSTTIPAVAVDASMYGATGTSAEITSLTNNFLPAQVANATANGLNPLVYASEALGLVFAFGNENGNTTFANNFGPSNSTMPNTAAGDAAFATAASSTIFGSASTANLVNVMGGFVSFWKGFFTANGVPGATTAAQIDLAARGASWGDMVGVALANNLGPLNGQAINFLDDAAQGSAVYGASLVGQPAHQPF